MEKQLLSNRFRPKTFVSVVGQDELLKLIRGHLKKGKIVNAWMFDGPKGVGKTTISRIMAVSFQCSHQQKFGMPCIECRRNKHSFSIVEIDGTKISTKELLEPVLESANYEPPPGSLKRVYIVNEVHRVSEGAQSLLLALVEDIEPDTVWIFTTTRPRKVLDTLQSRCICYHISGLQSDDIKTLVMKALEFDGSALDPVALADALIEEGINGPRQIVNAVDKYIAGASPERAAKVGTADTDTYKICRCITKGDWAAVAIALKEASSEDASAIRLSVAGYLSAVLLDEADVSDRGKAVANAIVQLTTMPYTEEASQWAATKAILYQLCSLFSKYKL